VNRSQALAVFCSLFLVACGPSSSSASVHSPTPGSPSPSASASPPPAAVTDWVEYHGDAGRAGQGPSSPALGSPEVAWGFAVDATVYASPLIYHGRVIVATENNTVYSINLSDGSVFWRVHLGTPVNAYSLP